MNIQLLSAESKLPLAAIILGGGLTYVFATFSRRAYMFRGWQQWPVAEATVEAAEVRSFKGRFFVRIGYSFPLSDSFMSGWEEKSFPGEDEADAFAASIQGQKMIIRFNPRNPEHSRIDEGNIVARV